MKKIIVLALFAIVGSTLTFVTPSYALDEALLKGVVNPGPDPADSQGRSDKTEATVSARGIENCPECMAHLKGGKLDQDSTFRGSSAVSSGKSKSVEATK